MFGHDRIVFCLLGMGDGPVSTLLPALADDHGGPGWAQLPGPASDTTQDWWKTKDKRMKTNLQ